MPIAQNRINQFKKKKGLNRLLSNFLFFIKFIKNIIYHFLPSPSFLQILPSLFPPSPSQTDKCMHTCIHTLVYAIYKYSLPSLLVVYVYVVWAWPLCIGQPSQGLVPGRGWCPSHLSPIVCSSLSKGVNTLSQWHFCLRRGSTNGNSHSWKMFNMSNIN